MSSADEIDSAVSKLSSDELSTFRAWFAEFDPAAWDKQSEADVNAPRGGLPHDVATRLDQRMLDPQR